MFKMEFETDNAAFDGYAAAEIARILRAAAKSVESGATGFTLYDVNGNKVGFAEYN